MLKKAISPILATVLLIVMAIVMGGIIMNFSEDSTVDLKDKASKQIDRSIKCSLDISVKIYETTNNEKYICYNRSGSNNLEVIIENQGNEAIKGVRIFLLDYNDNIKTINSLAKLAGHNITKYNVSINETDESTLFTFPPNKVIINPILDYSGDTIDICANNKIEVDEIEVCS